jgi:hypothetical protein
VEFVEDLPSVYQRSVAPITCKRVVSANLPRRQACAIFDDPSIDHRLDPLAEARQGPSRLADPLGAAPAERSLRVAMIHDDQVADHAAGTATPESFTRSAPHGSCVQNITAPRPA